MARQRRGERLRRLLGLWIALISIGACWVTAPWAGAEEVPRSVVLQYAPKVSFDPEEAYFPYSPDAFIERSQLNWSGCDLGDQLKRRGTINPAKLGIRSPSPFFSPWISSRSILGQRLLRCSSKRENGKTRFRTSDFTRPWSKGRAYPLAGIHGFELDADDATHPGYASQPSLAPVLYQSGVTRAGNFYVTYWFFYAYDQFKWGIPLQTHEGDWEQVAVLLTPDRRLFSVAYAAHGHFSFLSGSDIPLSNGSHVRSFVARGSHAMYPRPGEYDVFARLHDKAREGGITWNTWGSPDEFAPVEERSWWGFGGAWGSASRLHSDYSGPSGPGPWKPKYPAEWDQGSTRTLPLEVAPNPHPDPKPVQPPPNAPPTASGASFVMARNGGPNGVTYTKTLHATDDKRVDGWQLLYQDFGSGTQNFSWYQDGRFSLKPTAPAGARLTFNYRVVDDEGAASNTAVVTILVCQNGTSTPCPP